MSRRRGCAISLEKGLGTRSPYFVLLGLIKTIVLFWVKGNRFLWGKGGCNISGVALGH